MSDTNTDVIPPERDYTSLISPRNLETLWGVWLQHAPQEAQVGLDAAKDRGEPWACFPWPPVLTLLSAGTTPSPVYLRDNTGIPVVQATDTEKRFSSPTRALNRECLVWSGCPELEMFYDHDVSVELAEFLAQTVQPPEPYTWAEVVTGEYDKIELDDPRLLPPSDDGVVPVWAVPVHPAFTPAVAVGDGAYNEFVEHSARYLEAWEAETDGGVNLGPIATLRNADGSLSMVPVTTENVEAFIEDLGVLWENDEQPEDDLPDLDVALWGTPP